MAQPFFACRDRPHALVLVMKKFISVAVPLLSALAGFLAPLALSAQTTITFEDGQPDYTDVRTTTVADPLTFTITDGAAIQSGVIAGSGSLTKAGSGSITLTATNTYTGGTVVNAGILAVDHDGETTFGVLGSGTTTINGDAGSGLSGTLQFLTSSSAGSGVFTIGGSTTGGGYGGGVEFYGTSDRRQRHLHRRGRHRQRHLRWQRGLLRRLDRGQRDLDRQQ
jgi:autotransporter-associated beta strand protein